MRLLTKWQFPFFQADGDSQGDVQGGQGQGDVQDGQGQGDVHGGQGQGKDTSGVEVSLVRVMSRVARVRVMFSLVSNNKLQGASNTGNSRGLYGW